MEECAKVLQALKEYKAMEKSNSSKPKSVSGFIVCLLLVGR